MGTTREGVERLGNAMDYEHNMDCEHKWIALSNKALERHIFGRWRMGEGTPAWEVWGCQICGNTKVKRPYATDSSITNFSNSLAGSYWHRK